MRPQARQSRSLRPCSGSAIAAMLPRHHRLTDSIDISSVLRSGRRAGTSRLVLHVLVTAEPLTGDDRAVAPPVQASAQPVRIGLAVGRAVGNSVVRHQVQRRLRHLLRERLARLPQGSRVVVRALAPAAGVDSAQLAEDLESCLRRWDGHSRSRRARSEAPQVSA